MDLLQQAEHGLAEEIAEQRVHEDVQQRAEAHRREEDRERHLEHATRDGRNDAQARNESPKKDRSRAVVLQPLFGLVETLGCQPDEASVAVDQTTASHPRREVQKRRADDRAQPGGGDRLPQRHAAFSRVEAENEHQHVARNGNGHACFLNQQEHERGQESVLIQKRGGRPADFSPPVHHARRLLSQTLANPWRF